MVCKLCSKHNCAAFETWKFRITAGKLRISLLDWNIDSWLSAPCNGCIQRCVNCVALIILGISQNPNQFFNWALHGQLRNWAPGLVNCVPDFAHHLCSNLPEKIVATWGPLYSHSCQNLDEKFSQTEARFLASRVEGRINVNVQTNSTKWQNTSYSRFCLLFPDGSRGVAAMQPSAMLPRHAGGTLRKQCAQSLLGPKSLLAMGCVKLGN